MFIYRILPQRFSQFLEITLFRHSFSIFRVVRAPRNITPYVELRAPGHLMTSLWLFDNVTGAHLADGRVDEAALVVLVGPVDVTTHTDRPGLAGYQRVLSEIFRGNGRPPHRSRWDRVVADVVHHTLLETHLLRRRTSEDGLKIVPIDGCQTFDIPLPNDCCESGCIYAFYTMHNNNEIYKLWLKYI